MIRMLACAITAITLIATAWLAVIVADRTPPVTDYRITIMPNQVMQGAAFQLDIETFYRRPCWAFVTRTMYDSRGDKYALPALTVPPSPPGPQHSESTLTVSPRFPPGEGRYVSKPNYGCNWFQRIFWPIPAPERTASFTVVQREPPQ